MAGFRGEVLHYPRLNNPVSTDVVNSNLIKGEGLDMTDLIYNWKVVSDVKNVM